jgi:hypothetical protein
MRKTVLAIVAVTAGPAAADDGAAVLAAGGIVFTRGTPVQMLSEDLYVSPTKVRVRFEFFNPAKRDVATVVAFPLPDLDNVELGPPTAIGTTKYDPVNFVGFRVRVDGQPRAFATEQRALLKDRDITGLLKAAGMPVNVTTEGGRQAREQALEQMTPAQRAQLVAAGAIEDDTGFPNWTTRTRFYWAQVFPAETTTVIEHEYQPVTGNWSASRDLFDDPELAKQFCAKPDIAHAPTLNGPAYQTQYVLSTAKTWSGPIRRFHLTLDKLKPGAVLSLCWDGVLKKTSPTAFTFDARNYVPTRDIDMVVLE